LTSGLTSNVQLKSNIQTASGSSVFIVIQTDVHYAQAQLTGQIFSVWPLWKKKKNLIRPPLGACNMAMRATKAYSQVAVYCRNACSDLSASSYAWFLYRRPVILTFLMVFFNVTNKILF